MRNLVKHRLQNEMTPSIFGNLVDHFFNDTVASNGGSAFVPEVDLLESKENYEIHLAAPGLKKEDFNIEWNHDLLTINGERKRSDKKKEGNYYRRETQYGSFKRTFQLPDNVNAEKTQAKYEDGILFISIPKDEVKNLKQVIAVN